jgi:hypothetical protein
MTDERKRALAYQLKRKANFTMEVLHIWIPLVLTALVIAAAFFLDATTKGDFPQHKE